MVDYYCCVEGSIIIIIIGKITQGLICLGIALERLSPHIIQFQLSMVRPSDESRALKISWSRPKGKRGRVGERMESRERGGGPMGGT